MNDQSRLQEIVNGVQSALVSTIDRRFAEYGIVPQQQQQQQQGFQGFPPWFNPALFGVGFGSQQQGLSPAVAVALAQRQQATTVQAPVYPQPVLQQRITPNAGLDGLAIVRSPQTADAPTLGRARYTLTTGAAPQAGDLFSVIFPELDESLTVPGVGLSVTPVILPTWEDNTTNKLYAIPLYNTSGTVKGYKVGTVIALDDATTFPNLAVVAV